MKIKSIILVLSILILTYGCAVFTQNIDNTLSPDNIIESIKANSPVYCSYRGKASVDLKGQQQVSFTVLLNKKCSNEALINVLGALNSPIAYIKYENNQVDVQTQSHENTEAIKRVADNSIFHIISYFKTSHTIPDSTNYKLTFSNSAYIFTDNSGNKIYADDKFRINKYVEGSIISEYGWDKNSHMLEYIRIISPEGTVRVKFLNKKGWKTQDGQ